MDPKQRFYRHFLDSEAVLKDQITLLESIAAIGSERQEAIDHILAGISKLQNEVADAADFTPAYDRKQYSEAVKALHDKLNETVAKVKPKLRFQFKRNTTAAAVSTTHVDMGSPENDPRLQRGSLSTRRDSENVKSINPASVEEDVISPLPLSSSSRNYNEEMSRPNPTGSSIRKPSFSTAKQIGISNQTGLHIILPGTAARGAAAGSLTHLKGCVVDMSIISPPPGTEREKEPQIPRPVSFPGLAIQDVSESLIVAGRVGGPVHITGVKDSVVVVVARQVRIHECEDVDIYLHCGSHPIIEDCRRMRFAPLPECYMTEEEKGGENQWNQVDDFKWLKTGQSPNWMVLPEEQRLAEEVWTRDVPGRPGVSVEETLATVGVPRSR